MPVMSIYLNTVSQFVHSLTAEKGTLVGRAESHAQRVDCAVEKRFSSRKAVAPSARTGYKTTLVCTLEDFRRMGKRADTRLSWFDSELAFRTPPRKKRRLSLFMRTAKS